LIVPFRPGEEVVDGRRIRSVHERFVFSSWARVTGRGPQDLLSRIFRGARIVVEAGGESALVRGWAMSAEAGREPFVFVSHPWLGTAIGLHIRETLLGALAGEKAA